MKFNIFYFLSLVLIFSNCKDKFEFSTERGEQSLVVDGTISDGPGPYKLNLGLTSAPNRLPDPLPGASIFIHDDEGNQEMYVDNGKGKYSLPGNIVKGIKGKSYFIEIKLPDGTSYRSTTELMPELQAEDSSFFRITKDKDISEEGIPIELTKIKILINTKLPKTNEATYFRWATEESYMFFPTCIPNPFGCPLPCYVFIPVSSNNLQLIKSTDYTSSSINELLIKSKGIDYTFGQKHYFSVTQYAINLNAYNYWKKVQVLTTRTGSIFDTPPAHISGNIYNINNPDENVYGYFEASAQKVIRIGIPRGYIKEEITVPCNYTSSMPNPSSYSLQCTDCLSNPGGTTEIPDWFK